MRGIAVFNWFKTKKQIIKSNNELKRKLDDMKKSNEKLKDSIQKYRSYAKDNKIKGEVTLESFDRGWHMGMYHAYKCVYEEIATELAEASYEE